MGPRTVAQCWTGLRASPSLTCHSILKLNRRLSDSEFLEVTNAKKEGKGRGKKKKKSIDHVRASQLREYLVKEGNTSNNALYRSVFHPQQSLVI